MTAHSALHASSITISVAAMLGTGYNVWATRRDARRAERAAHLASAAADRAKTFRQIAARCESRARDAQARRPATGAGQ